MALSDENEAVGSGSANEKQFGVGDPSVLSRKPADMVQYMVEEGGLTHVPADFIKPPHDRASQRRKATEDGQQVAVIDLAMLEDKPGREQVLADTIRASEEWGFFQVINHGVPDTLMDAARDISKRFFALTSAKKEEFKMRQVAGVGYGRFVVERPGVAKDWVDRLQLNSVNKDELEAYDLVLNNPPGCQELLEKYGNAVYELARRILAILSEGMGQNLEFFFTKTAADGFLRTSINYYPPCPQPDLVMGTSCHEDASSITILQQDDVCGLEVLKDGNWVSVSPIPHAFVVNIGDILQVVSNDKLKSVTHRAVAGHVSRISIANFLMPRRDTKVQPATELCSKTKPAVFGSMEYGSYLVEVVATNLLRNKVDTLRVKHPVDPSSS